MKYLEEIGEKRKLFSEKQHKLSDKAMMSRASTAQNKSELRLPSLLKEHKNNKH